MRRAVAGAGLAGLLLLVGIVLVAAPWAAPWSAAARLGAAAVVEAGGVSQAAATAAVARDSVAVPPPPPPTTALRAPTTTVAGVNASAVEKKAELGRAGWTLIHTTAATLPTPLTPAARDGVVALLRAVAQTYPCKECREHFASFIAVHPIEYVAGRWQGWNDACRSSARGACPYGRSRGRTWVWGPSTAAATMRMSDGPVNSRTRRVMWWGGVLGRWSAALPRAAVCGNASSLLRWCGRNCAASRRACPRRWNGLAEMPLAGRCGGWSDALLT